MENIGARVPDIPDRESKPIVLKKFPKMNKQRIFYLLITLLVVVLGIGTGWLLSGRNISSKTSEKRAEQVQEQASGEKGEAGIADESVFSEKQSPEGILLEGGIKGEGTHHLDRGMGEMKYVYLTSTVINLQDFVGKKVKVWGETLSAVSAGWLMDVGKIKVLE